MAYTLKKQYVDELVTKVGFKLDDVDIEVFDFVTPDGELPLLSVKDAKNQLLMILNLKTMRTTVKSKIQFRVPQDLAEKIRETTKPELPLPDNVPPKKCLIID
jgi:hypothetical protein